MKLAHTIQVTVFAKADEDKYEIESKLKELFPFNLIEERIQIEQSRATGADDRPILIYKVVLTKERHTNPFIENLREKLPREQKDLVLRQLHSRLDDDMDFFIRLDKDKLMNENTFLVTDSGNCFHIKITIASFPKKRSNAEKVIREIFR
ncbi:MAG TPA: RNA-binding domain-containing protein [Candidatus Nanoarchaeia archaeon]|nr:RNA-binding domain-containing protein [Candidatus Nanoarchaeia archaeon]